MAIVLTPGSIPMYRVSLGMNGHEGDDNGDEAGTTEDDDDDDEAGTAEEDDDDDEVGTADDDDDDDEVGTTDDDDDVGLGYKELYMVALSLLILSICPYTSSILRYVSSRCFFSSVLSSISCFLIISSSALPILSVIALIFFFVGDRDNFTNRSSCFN